MSEVVRPGALLGSYPERRNVVTGISERMLSSLARWTHGAIWSEKLQINNVIRKVEQFGCKIDGLSADELNTEVNALRQRLMRQGFTDELVVRSFTIIRTMADRVLGMRHFNVQLMGGWIMLKGMLAEMETGEGKTLTATLPACTAALAGTPVHVITVNDYLAKRDAEQMGPLYRALGLSVGVITETMGMEERKAAYSCDVTYCTNKQVAFDYLRDQINRCNRTGALSLKLDKLKENEAGQSPLLLRGLCYAIIDEADSVLIDEARTPLIISRSRPSCDQQQVYEQALFIASQLRKGIDYRSELRTNTVEFTEQGQSAVCKLSSQFGGVWSGSRRSELLVCQALKAQLYYLRDTHYLVEDGRVQIIDEHTGRRMPDRSWEQGLHQAIEVKEGCEITSERETLARISYQRFFRRYLRLAGMTGTAQEVKSEVQTVYNLNVVRVPTHRPVQRARTGHKMYLTADNKWKAIVARIQVLHRQGRPVIVGTRSVKTSEYLSSKLEAAGLPHQVLNARQDRYEADIVRGAGQQGRITVATNMAGRGTDIMLGRGVPERGGLHVIATELNDSRRIDRQLFGRCGRQGDAGSFEVMLDLDDPLIGAFYSEKILQFMSTVCGRSGVLPAYLGEWFVRLPQYVKERQHQRSRRQLLKVDEQLEDMLAFSGSGE